MHLATSEYYPTLAPTATPGAWHSEKGSIRDLLSDLNSQEEKYAEECAHSVEVSTDLRILAYESDRTDMIHSQSEIDSGHDSAHAYHRLAMDEAEDIMVDAEDTIPPAMQAIPPSPPTEPSDDSFSDDGTLYLDTQSDEFYGH